MGETPEELPRATGESVPTPHQGATEAATPVIKDQSTADKPPAEQSALRGRSPETALTRVAWQPLEHEKFPSIPPGLLLSRSLPVKRWELDEARVGQIVHSFRQQERDQCITGCLCCLLCGVIGLCVFFGCMAESTSDVLNNSMKLQVAEMNEFYAPYGVKWEFDPFERVLSYTY